MEFINSLFLLAFVLLVPKLKKLYLAPSEARKKGAPSGSPRLPFGERLTFFDFAKGIAIIAVILIHSIYLFTAQQQASLIEKFPDYNPYWLDVINNLARFAVGFFFIASGALLSTGLTKKKVIKVFIPYILVSAIVGVSQSKTLDLIAGGTIRGDLLPPFYFIPVLFQFYLLYPLLDKHRHKKYFLPMTLFVSYAAYAVPSLAYIAGIPTFGPFLFLFTFGMAYSDKLKSNKPLDIRNLSLVIPIYVGLQLMLPGHYYNSRFFYAPALFVVLHYVWYKTKSLGNIIFLQTFGKFSLWIYLIHFSIESFFVNIIKFSFSYSVYLYVLLISVLTTIVSGIGAHILSKTYQALFAFQRQA